MRGVVPVVMGIALFFTACSGLRPLSPAETVERFVRAVRADDVQGVEHMMISQLRQVGVFSGNAFVKDLKKRFPEKVPYMVAEERVVGETAYVEIRLLYSPELLWEIRKPEWTVGPLADEFILKTIFLGKPTWLPDRNELLNGPVPVDVLRNWLDSPPRTSYREARAALDPIIEESTALGPRPFSLFVRGKPDERSAAWDAKAEALRARARVILNDRLIPAATYDMLARRYMVDGKTKSYAERHRFVLGREDGKWLVRDLFILDSSGKEITLF